MNVGCANSDAPGHCATHAPTRPRSTGLTAHRYVVAEPLQSRTGRQAGAVPYGGSRHEEPQAVMLRPLVVKRRGAVLGLIATLLAALILAVAPMHCSSYGTLVSSRTSIDRPGVSVVRDGVGP